MDTSLQHSIIIGANGGIGKAMADILERQGRTVHRLSRSEGTIDLTNEASIESAAKRVHGAMSQGSAISEIIVATGFLHDADYGPEKSWRDLDPARLAKAFAINTIGPALVARHFLPLLPRTERAVFAALSARVGSISNNRLGGWHGYRASKAALNQLIRTLAIELARTRPEAICVGLHPGTVDTPLSAPFQANVPSGKLFTADYSARQLVDVIASLSPGDSGWCYDWAGKHIEP